MLKGERLTNIGTHFRFCAMGIVACSLVACGRTETNEQQAQAMDRFEQAWELQEQAVSGVIYERDRIKSDEEGNILLGETIEEYRQEKQALAAEKAQQISGTGLPGGQLAAKNLLLAQSQASKGRKLARDASLAWTEQADLHTRLINSASGIALSAHTAEQYGKLDFREQIASAREALEEQTRQEQELVATVGKGESRVKELEGKLQDLTTASRQKAGESEELARKAFTAKGQAQYDLYVRSAEASNEADALTAQADNIRLQLNLGRSGLRVDRIRLEGVQGRVESLAQALKSLQNRSADTQKLAREAGTRAQSLAEEQFQPGFEELTGGYREQVVAQFDEAIETMGQALESAEAAASSAPPESRNDLQLHAIGLRLALGTIVRQRLLAETGYRDLLKALHGSLSQLRPALAESIAQAFAASEERLAAIAGQGEELLGKALEDLGPLTEGQGPQQRLPLRYLAQTYQTLAAVTGKDQYRSLAEQTTQRIGQLGRQESP